MDSDSEKSFDKLVEEHNKMTEVYFQNQLSLFVLQKFQN